MPATIKSGSTGSDVEQWQKLLTGAGFATDVTGVFDAATIDSTKKWQAAKGLVADGVVGPASWGAMTGVAAAGKTDKWAQYGRDALLEAWTTVTGETPSLAELQIAGAMAQLESNYGRSVYKRLDHATSAVLDTSPVINNWGAIQTNDPAHGFLATDTSSTKVTADNPHGYYDHLYRVYDSPAAGAEDFVRALTVKRPASWALMKQGDIDAYTQQMWAGKLPNGQLNKDPISGTLGYFEQAPASRAKGLETRIADIAFTLNEPIAAKRGGPVAPGEVVSPGGGEDESGGIIPGVTPTRVGLAAALAAMAIGAWRIFTGSWPRFPW